MASITFSSTSLPAHLDDRQKFNLWRDIYTSKFGLFDFGISERFPFTVTMQLWSAGHLAVGRSYGTLERTTRTAREVAADGGDSYGLIINQGATMSGMAARRNFELPGGAAVLLPFTEPYQASRPANGANDAWLDVIVPGPLLRTVLGNPDDLIGRGTPAGSEALSLLVGYVDLLQHGNIAHPDLLVHATNTLLDLIALTLNAKGEREEIASARGLRAARLQAALGLIERRYEEIGFSTRDVAAAIGISTRYVNDILYESGTNFSDRVLELRLQRARAMLADRRNDGMRIGDIAYASGFSDISHFNRSFRRRFGLTPTAAR